MRNPNQDSQRSIARHLWAGSIVTTALVVGLAGWAWTAELAGAVIAAGVIVVESEVKQVQHPTGGVVSELNVRNDDYVNSGDIVVRLDATQTQANVAVFSKTLDELYARQARLEAEKNNATSILFPEALLARDGTDPELSHILQGERKLFDLRLEARKGQKAQLRERSSQLQEEVKGLTEQIAAKTEEISLIQDELKGVMDLWTKKLIPFTRVTSLKRDGARLNGERGLLIASNASTGGKIAEVQLQVIQVDDDARSKVAEELSDVRARIAELNERKIAAEDQLKRIDIRAPQTGRVHELAVHTIGQVITPGEKIMLIVPDDDALSVEAKVSPNDIDQLRSGQPAILRFSAFNMRTTPEVNGTVTWISPDVTKDQRTDTSYYTLRIAVSEKELARLEGLRIVPGMPVEAFVQTGTRTALSYFLKPLTDQVMRTFRDS